MSPSGVKFCGMNAVEWSPAWCDWFLYWKHVDLLGQMIAFLGVAADTGGDNIFPAIASAFISWDYVVKVEVFF